MPLKEWLGYLSLSLTMKVNSPGSRYQKQVSSIYATAIPPFLQNGVPAVVARGTKLASERFLAWTTQSFEAWAKIKGLASHAATGITYSKVIRLQFCVMKSR